jgi:hypothetical protein
MGWNMMSLDKGSIIAGSHSMPVAEIERETETRVGCFRLLEKCRALSLRKYPSNPELSAGADCRNAVSAKPQ